MELELDHCFLLDQEINAVRQVGYWDFNWTHALPPRKQDFGYGLAEKRRCLVGKLRLVAHRGAPEKDGKTGQVDDRIKTNGEVVQPAALAEDSLKRLGVEDEQAPAEVEVRFRGSEEDPEAGRLAFELQGEMLAEVNDELQKEIKGAMMDMIVEAADTRDC